jgi:hypothetical protein
MLTLISHIKGRKYTDRIRQEDVKDVKDVKYVKDNVTYGPKRKEVTWGCWKLLDHVPNELCSSSVVISVI